MIEKLALANVSKFFVILTKPPTTPSELFNLVIVITLLLNDNSALPSGYVQRFKVSSSFLTTVQLIVPVLLPYSNITEGCSLSKVILGSTGGVGGSSSTVILNSLYFLTTFSLSKILTRPLVVPGATAVTVTVFPSIAAVATASFVTETATVSVSPFTIVAVISASVSP